MTTTIAEAETFTRGNPDTYGGLLRPGETPEQALRRLERAKNFTKKIGTDEGQRLLAAATKQVQAVPNGGLGARKSRAAATAEVMAATDPTAAELEDLGIPVELQIAVAAGEAEEDVRECVRDATGCGTHNAVWPAAEPTCWAISGKAAPAATLTPAEQAVVATAVAIGERAVDNLTRPEDELVCVGSNHVPGCEHLAGAVPPTSPTPVRFLDVPVALLDIGPNVRVDPGELDELAASIQEVGVLEPIRIAHAGDRWTVLVGQRRTLAARQVGLETLPAIVDDEAKSDAQLSIEQLSENLIRLDMNAMDKAAAVNAVLEGDKKLTQAALAKRLGKSAPWITGLLGLLDAPADVQELVRTDRIGIAHAKALSGLPVEEQVRLATSAADNGVSAHALEQSAKWERDRQRQIEEGKAVSLSTATLVDAMLVKVANVATATIGLVDYGGHGTAVGALLEAAGWKVIAGNEGWQFQSIDQAGSCGCKGVWRLELPYGANAKPKLFPACRVPAHRAARQAAANAAQQAELAAEVERRAAEKAAAQGHSDRIAGFLTDTLGSALSLRATVYALLLEDSDITGFIDRYLTEAEQEAESHGDRDFDSLWAAITRIPAEELPRELALAVTAILGAAYDGADAPLSALDDAIEAAGPPAMLTADYVRVAAQPAGHVDAEAIAAAVNAEPLVWRSLRKSPHGGYTPSHLFPPSMQIAWDRKVVGVAACGFDPFDEKSGNFDMQIDREGSTLKAVQKQCAKCVALEAAA